MHRIKTIKYGTILNFPVVCDIFIISALNSYVVYANKQNHTFQIILLKNVVLRNNEN
jgi:hypothetical protein